MMINFETLATEASNKIEGNQKLIFSNSALQVYWGISIEGNLRLSFMSSIPTDKLESTELIKISQGMENENVYWICFDLLDLKAKKVYFTFCENLISVIENIFDEKEALKKLKTRYNIWKRMFKKKHNNSLSMAELQGLYGELYFLKEHIIKDYGIEKGIKSWSGPDKKSKDFSIGKNWFEIKTIGSNTNHIHISSLSQLSSQYEGHLIVIKVESMSSEFDNGTSNIGQLFNNIVGLIEDNELEEIFMSKLHSLGLIINDDLFNRNFNIKSVDSYLVNDNFPRLTEKDIKYSEITDLEYSLNLISLDQYKE